MAKDYIVEPEEKDKVFIHGLIYEYLKPGKDASLVYTAVRGLLDLNERKIGTVRGRVNGRPEGPPPFPGLRRRLAGTPAGLFEC
jgi:hypothetical protein